MKRVELQLNGQQGKLYLYGTFGTDILAKDINPLIREAETKGTDLLVCMHSPGGDPLEGMAILTALKSAKIIIDTQNDGLVASMASLIFAIGRKRYAAKYSKFMVHQGSGSLSGQVHELEQAAGILKHINKEQAEILAKATGKTEQWVSDNWLLAGRDYWMTATEAYQSGLVNQSLTDGDMIIDMIDAEDVSVLAAHYDKHLFSIKHNHNNMELTLLTFELNKVDGVSLPDKASLTEVAGAVARVVSTNLKLSSDLQAEQGKVTNLQAEVETLKTKGIEDKATALVETALTMGKITATEKDHYLKLAKTEDGYGTVKAIFDGMAAHTSVQAALQQQGAASEADKQLLALSWDEAHKKDGALAKIKAKYPERYALIFEEKHGRKPKMD